MLEHFWKGFTKAASIATPILKRLAGTGANVVTKVTRPGVTNKVAPLVAKSNVTRGQVAPLVAKPNVTKQVAPAVAKDQAQSVKFRDVTPTTPPPFKGQIPAQPAVTPAVNVGEKSLDYSKFPETLKNLTGIEQISRRNMLHQGGVLSR